jgi:hypothetical protein
LLREQEFGVLAATDGYLLLGRGRGGSHGAELPASFYTFARSDQHSVPRPASVTFGGVLELVGYDYAVLNVVHQHHLPATVTTYWRALDPLKLDYGFDLFFTRSDGAIVYHYQDDTSTSVWYPTHNWAVGEVVRLQTPLLEVGRLNDVLIAVIPPGNDAWAPGDRLQVSASDPSHEVLDGGTLLRLFDFQ